MREAYVRGELLIQVENRRNGLAFECDDPTALIAQEPEGVMADVIPVRFLVPVTV